MHDAGGARQDQDHEECKPEACHVFRTSNCHPIVANEAEKPDSLYSRTALVYHEAGPGIQW